MKESKHKTHDLSVEAELTRTDRMQTTDRRGRKIRSHRYMKHLYGAEGSVTVSCSCADAWSESVDWHDEVQGSGMEELV